MGQLTQQDLMDLRREGYSDQEIAEAIREVQQEEAQQPQQQQRYQGNYAQHSAFSPQGADNLIKWQLELDNILERCEHILRGDIIVNENGNTFWTKNPNPSENVLNEYGVREMTRILSMYLNRNTILSDYDDVEIREKILDFGREFSDLIFMKYEKIFYYPSNEEVFKQLYNADYNEFLKEYIKLHFVRVFRKFFGEHEFAMSGNELLIKVDLGRGKFTYQSLSPEYKAVVLEELKKDFAYSNNPVMKEIRQKREEIILDKRKEYPIIVREIVDTVHSAYKRALHGGEKRSLREARQITQSEQIAGGITVNAGGVQPQQTRGILNPMRYIAGKYK